MTTLAMIFGMLPTALALGSGAEFRAPMAYAVIGGLITSTLLTLLVVPVVYTYWTTSAGGWGGAIRRWTSAPGEVVAKETAKTPALGGLEPTLETGSGEREELTASRS